MSQTEEKLSLNGWSPLTPNHLKKIREAASGIMWLYQCAYFRFDHFLTFLITTIRLVEIKSFIYSQKITDQIKKSVWVPYESITLSRKEKKRKKIKNGIFLTKICSVVAGSVGTVTGWTYWITLNLVSPLNHMGKYSIIKLLI